MATLGTVFGSVYFATRGPKKTGAANTPPINASSKDEENFIQYVAGVAKSPLGLEPRAVTQDIRD